MQVTVKVPGSCGELIQGMRHQKNFLVTCPIDCYTVVTMSAKSVPGISVQAAQQDKIIQAITKTMELLAVPDSRGYHVVVDSELTVGKGMASSTADMTAAIIACTLLEGASITLEELSRVLIDIEPSDGIFYPGIVAYDHLQGSFCETLGEAFPVNFLIYDYGGEVDTIAFNANPRLLDINLSKQAGIEKAYALLQEAFDQKNIAKLGEAVSISALENQKLLHKENLEQIIETARRFGAYGVNVAHSGTLIGIVNDSSSDLVSLKKEIKSQYPKLTCLGNLRMVNGGYEYIIK